MLGYGSYASSAAMQNHYSQVANTPLERLGLKKIDAEVRLKKAQEELETIDSAIDLLSKNTQTTAMLDALFKLGIV